MEVTVVNEAESDKAGKRERTKARNRTVILDAAREVFVDIGYDAASVRDIVARTDLAPGTFYNYFPDKRSVLLALVGEASGTGTRLIREARARATTPEERVYAGFRAYFEFIAGDRALFALMRRNFATLRSLGVDETGFAAGLAELEAELRAAIRAGQMPPLPLAYITRVVGAITLELGAEMATQDPPDVEGATRFAAELCLGGLERIIRAPYPWRGASDLRLHTNGGDGARRAAKTRPQKRVKTRVSSTKQRKP